MAAILLLPLLHIPLPIHAAELEVYGRLPSLEHVALSPDGLRLAFIRTDADTRLLAVVSLSDRKVTHGFRLGENKVRSIKWADDNNLMIFGSATSLPPGLRGRTQEWVMLDVFDLSQHKLRPVPRLDVGSNDRYMNVVRGEAMVRTVNGHTVLFVPGIYVEGMTLPALFRIDLQTGQQSIVRRGSLETQGWLVDEAGEVVAEEDYFDQDRRWVIKIRRDRRLKEVAHGHETIEHPQVLGFGPQADTLLIESIEDGDSVWRLMSLKDGRLMPLTAERTGLNRPLEDRTTYRMIGGVTIEDDDHYVFFDPGMQRGWDAIVRAFKGEHLKLASYSKDFKKMVVRVDGMQDGFTYQLVDMTTLRADLVGDVYNGVKPLEVRRLTYRAADGLEIPAYLTLPRGPGAQRAAADRSGAWRPSRSRHG